MRQTQVKLSGPDLEELLEALGDQLELCKTEDQRRNAHGTIDLFIRLQAAADTPGAGVWADAELPSWALEQLRRAAITARSVPELQQHAKELTAQVNSLRQKASAKAKKPKAIRTIGGKGRTPGGASHAAPSSRSAHTAPAASAAPAAAPAAGSSSTSRETVPAGAAQGDGGA